MSKSLVTVKVKSGLTDKEKNENFNKAMKKFKRKVADSGHLIEVRDRQQFVKPSSKRRQEKMKAVREQFRVSDFEYHEREGKMDLYYQKNNRKRKK